MAFQLPSSIPNFNVQQPPAFDPLAQQQKQATLSGLLSENALRNQLAPLQVQEQQQKIQQQQIQTEMAKMQLQGQQGLTKWLQEGDTNEEIPPDKFALNDKIATFVGVDPKDPIMDVVRSMAQHGVPAPVLMTEAQQMLQRRSEYNKGTEEQQKIIKDNYDTWKDATAQLFNAKPEDQSIMVAQMLPRLQAATHLSPELDSMVQLLQKSPRIGVPIAYNLVAAQDKALGLSKASSEAATAAQKVIPPSGGMSPDTAQQVQKDITVATNPEIQAGKEAVAKAEGAARAQVQLAMEPLRLQVQQQFGNQKDARDKIESTVLKPYQDKLTDINMARQAISEAQTNPVSARAAIFKMVGVAQPTGSHRVLPMEFTAFKYPGGITDQVQEHFNDFLKGEPWTPEIAQAANAFIDGQEKAQQRGLNSGIDNVNKLYGTNVGEGLKQTALSNLPKSLTADQIKAYATAHGVSEDEVKRQAKAKGIQVP